MNGTAKAKPPVVKLEPGTDLVGTVKFVSYYPEKEKDGETYGAQWGLTGTFNGQDARVFIDLRRLVNDMMEFVQNDGLWPDGNPKYKWTGTKPIRLHPYVRDKKHFVGLTVEGEKNGSPPIQQAPATAFDHINQMEQEVVGNDVRQRWADIQESYEASVKIAMKAWNGYEVAPESVVAAAATVFIEANKRNLPAPPKRSDQ